MHVVMFTIMCVDGISYLMYDLPCFMFLTWNLIQRIWKSVLLNQPASVADVSICFYMYFTVKSREIERHKQRHNIDSLFCEIYCQSTFCQTQEYWKTKTEKGIK